MNKPLPVTLPVIANPDNAQELMLDLGPELCAYMGWQPGDVVEWVDNKDGTWTIRKQETLTGTATPKSP